jgi:cytochrome b
MNYGKAMVKVWDPVVRIGHWVLVAAFFTAYLTEDDFLTQHVYAGYVVAAILCVRLVWGFVGTRYARFGDFVRSPVVILRYMSDLLAGREKRYIGHNPAGGAMIVALLLGLAGTTVSGLMLYAIEEGEGPLAGWVAAAPASHSATLPVAKAYANADDRKRPGRTVRRDEAAEEFWEETHEVCANLTLLLVSIHVAGMFFSSFRHRENLVRAMFTGQKPSEL